eukprot:274060_1
MEGLEALINPKTNPNIYYLSPIPKPMNKKVAFNMIPDDDEFTIINKHLPTEMDNIQEDYMMNSNGHHLNINNGYNGDIYSYKVPPNSTRDGNGNKSINKARKSFNYKRLSQTLLKVNGSVFADTKSETDEENELFNDITYDTSSSYDHGQLHKSHKTDTKLERLEKLIQSFKMLQKELPNLLGINENSDILEITVPNINKYKNWDLNHIMFWIKYLENGRFKKYEEQLMLGFTESGIAAQDLPNLSTADLSAPPFNIKVFRDKRDLIAHFKKLSKNNC